MSTRGQVGVIGLGLMGTAISERLLEQGFDVRVWNRTREKAKPLIDQGAVWSEEPGRDCDRVVISLYSSNVVHEVINGIEPTLRDGQCFVDTTTGVPEQSVMMERWLADRGVRYLDAPISGSSQQTRMGHATVIVGGERQAFEECADLWPVLGKRVFHVGSCGNAAKLKLVTNLVLGLNRAALAEGLVFADAIGVEPGIALEVLKNSAANSKVLEAKGRKMVEKDFSVQARLSQHLKDVNLMLDAAQDHHINLPMSRTHHRLLEAAVEAGLGELDNSAIIDVLWQCAQEPG
ncbi:NAD(P)-dependent oxidoreductase [Planctomicrobium sp. SH661]|uniref:NAD(P)-dependent oxidoreductase n=1 Tax=Planctomicrobium sp. SH661 TaxID=3448124 RepID=UPI003F5B4090